MSDSNNSGSPLNSWIFDNNGEVLDAAWTAMDQTYTVGLAKDTPLAWTDNSGNGNSSVWAAPAGWTVAASIDGPHNGHFYVYQNKATQEVMIVPMGTNGNSDTAGWMSNIDSYGKSQWNDDETKKQLFEAVNDALKDMGPGAKLIVAGDSKGGALSQFVMATLLEDLNKPDSIQSQKIGFDKDAAIISHFTKNGNIAGAGSNIALISRVGPGSQKELGTADFDLANNLAAQAGIQAFYTAPKYVNGTTTISEAVSQLGGDYLDGVNPVTGASNFYIDNDPGVDPNSPNGKKNGGGGPIASLTYLHRIAYSDYDAAAWLDANGSPLSPLSTLFQQDSQASTKTTSNLIAGFRALGSILSGGAGSPDDNLQTGQDAINGLVNDPKFYQLQNLVDGTATLAIPLLGSGSQVAALVLPGVAATLVAASGDTDPSDLTGPGLYAAVAKLWNATQGSGSPPIGTTGQSTAETFTAVGTSNGYTLTGTSNDVIAVVIDDDTVTLTITRIDGIQYNADGSYTTFTTHPGLGGDAYFDNYTSSGQLISDNTARSGGSNDADFYNADGSSSGFSQSAAGRVVYSADGRGDYEYAIYGATNALLASGEQAADGSGWFKVGSQELNFSSTSSDAISIPGLKFSKTSTGNAGYDLYYAPLFIDIQGGGFAGKNSLTIGADFSGASLGLSLGETRYSALEDVPAAGNTLSAVQDMIGNDVGDTWTGSNGDHGSDVYNMSEPRELFYAEDLSTADYWGNTPR